MKRIFCLAALLCFFLPTAAKCQTCHVTTAPVSFGSYIPSSTIATYSQGTVTVSCSGTLSLDINYTITLSPGLYSDNNYSNRQMSSGNSYLSYQLYLDSAYTSIWGDGTGGTSDQTGICLITVLDELIPCGSPYTVYGEIPPLQRSATPGNYGDTITVTVSYSSLL